jgi:hypothetical protein
VRALSPHRKPEPDEPPCVHSRRGASQSPDLREVHLSRSLIATLAMVPLILAQPGAGQEPIPGTTLSREVREQVVQFLNAPTTLRLPGGAIIPQGTTVEGNVGVLGGGLQLAGHIRGDLLVVNGDLRMEGSAVVEGAVLVVGGRVTGAEVARIGEDLEVYRASLRYRIREDRVEAEEASRVQAPRLLGADLGPARVRFTLRTEGNYNRAEGLPVNFGPILEAGGRNPLLVEGFGIWRSVDGLDISRENLGYQVRVEQALGGSGELFLGLSSHSRIDPVEDRGLSDTEASLATFLLRRDFLDYVERTGWSASVALRPVDRPLRFRAEYREEDHATVALRNPWTIRNQEQRWRPMATMAEGSLRTLTLEATLDTRDDLRRPARGWWIQTRLRRAVGGDLRLPSLSTDPGPDPASHASGTFPLALDGAVDLRRYNRLGPDSQLHLRLLASGSMDGNPLPPQHQVALGGEGSIPGHPLFIMDCGARNATLYRGSEEVHPFYGCDRAVLGQIEYHGLLPFSWAPGTTGRGDWEWGALAELWPAWTFFLNGGRGWAVDGLGEVAPAEDSPFRADVGAGLHLGPLGLYWAYPLNRRDRGLNFFVRLQHRF